MGIVLIRTEYAKVMYDADVQCRLFKGGVETLDLIFSNSDDVIYISDAALFNKANALVTGDNELLDVMFKTFKEYEDKDAKRKVIAKIKAVITDSLDNLE